MWVTVGSSSRQNFWLVPNSRVMHSSLADELFCSARSRFFSGGENSLADTRRGLDLNAGGTESLLTCDRAIKGPKGSPGTEQSDPLHGSGRRHRS
jgi:hypothetical protein